MSRSSTTEANVSAESASESPFDSRDTRSTSPPIVLGSTLETNWPAK